MRTIYATSGAVEYVAISVTELTGKDISGDTVWMGLGGLATVPAEWIEATHLDGEGASVTVGILIDSSTEPGSYWPWVKVGDDPETVIERGSQVAVA